MSEPTPEAPITVVEIQHSPRFYYLQGMYLRGTLNDAGLTQAVTKTWITQAEADEIRASKVEQDRATVAAADALITNELSA
jgi:hypothetical protein